MPISLIHEDDSDFISQSGNPVFEIMEGCHFCEKDTRFWHRATHTPVCPDCAKKVSRSDLPNRKVKPPETKKIQRMSRPLQKLREEADLLESRLIAFKNDRVRGKDVMYVVFQIHKLQQQIFSIGGLVPRPIGLDKKALALAECPEFDQVLGSIGLVNGGNNAVVDEKHNKELQTMNKAEVWTIVRFPNGEWSGGGKVNDPAYDCCEVYVVRGTSFDSCKKKAQRIRAKLVKTGDALPTQSNPMIKP